MDTHVKIVAILHIAFGVLGLFGALILFMVFGGAATIVGIAAAPSEAITAVPIISIVGSFVIFILLICALPGLIGGIGLLNNENWGRILIVIVSFFNLFNIPIGTVLAVYSLFVLFSPETSQLFNRAGTPPPQPYQ